MQFINTRPKDRAEPLSSALKQYGHHVIHLPLLALSELPLTKALIEQYQQFLDADIVVVVSPIAARIGFKYYQQLNLPLEVLQRKIWIAVGQTTAKTLQDYQIESVVPDIETSEGMLSLPQLTSHPSQKIAFWRGIGGRTLMMQQLDAQGCDIINMLLYTRQMPDSSELLAQYHLQHHDIVLISSEASWVNWQQLLVNTNFECKDFYYIVLGDRVSERLIQEGQTCLTVYTLHADEIHQQILKCKR